MHLLREHPFWPIKFIINKRSVLNYMFNYTTSLLLKFDAVLLIVFNFYELHLLMARRELKCKRYSNMLYHHFINYLTRVVNVLFLIRFLFNS